MVLMDSSVNSKFAFVESSSADVLEVETKHNDGTEEINDSVETSSAVICLIRQRSKHQVRITWGASGIGFKGLKCEPKYLPLLSYRALTYWMWKQNRMMEQKK